MQRHHRALLPDDTGAAGGGGGDIHGDGIEHISDLQFPMETDQVFHSVTVAEST